MAEPTGIFLQITADEVAKHAKTRAEYHHQRAKTYLTKADEISALRRGAPNPTFDNEDDGTGYGKMSNRSSGQQDPVGELHRLAQFHRGHAERFRFMAEHVIEGRTYTLSMVDLAVLEIG